MKVEFLEKFYRDLDKIKLMSVKESIKTVISKAELAVLFSEIPNAKKLKGHKTAYRIRIGDYRIGVFVEGNIIQFARVEHRKNIYNLFP